MRPVPGSFLKILQLVRSVSGRRAVAIFQILLPLPAIIFAVWQADTGRAKKVAANILVASDGGILPPVLHQLAAGSRAHRQAGKLLCRNLLINTRLQPGAKGVRREKTV